MFPLLLAVLSAGGWQISEARDPITDKLEMTAKLRGDNAAIVFECAAGERPILSYQPDEFLGGGGIRYELRDFIFRFDAAKAERASWKHLDDYATPYTDKAAAAFVTKLLGSRKLAVRAERYDGRHIESLFDLDGAAQAFHQAFTACGIGR